MPSSRWTPSSAAAAWSARPQARAPGVDEVREARPELVGVRADERAPAGQVDVVAHDHERAGPEARVEAAGGIGQDDDPRAERLEQQDRLDDESRVVALVQVEAALEHDDRSPAELAQEQPADVARGRRRRPAGQVRERDRDRVDEVVGEVAETRPEHDADLGHERGPRADGGRQRGDAGRLLDGSGWGATGRGRTSGGSWGLLRASYATAGAGLRRPDERIDTGMPITTRRAVLGGGRCEAEPSWQRSARSDRRRSGGP